MKADRPASGAALGGLAVAGIAACCGLPLLLSLGAGITIARLGLRSWVLAVAGLIVTVAGAWRWRRLAGWVAPPDGLRQDTVNRRGGNR